MDLVDLAFEAHVDRVFKFLSLFVKVCFGIFQYRLAFVSALLEESFERFN